MKRKAVKAKNTNLLKREQEIEPALSQPKARPLDPRYHGVTDMPQEQTFFS
jgi:hypothetical protein